jgi:hypothetical protein
MYSDLFAVYPDANKKDAEALTAFFRANTDLGAKAQKLSVQTFQVLCKFGDFSAETAAEALSEDTKSAEEPARATGKGRRAPAVTAAAPVALTVNIQLQLPASAEGEVYDKLFAAMATHLKALLAPE